MRELATRFDRHLWEVLSVQLYQTQSHTDRR